MTGLEGSAALNAQSTFGRDGAMFEGLLGFVAQLSVVLWSLVILTAAIRFIGMRIYRHAAVRRALAETATESAVGVEVEAAQIAPIPAAATATVTMRLAPPRSRHAASTPSAPRSSPRVPTLATDSVEA